MAGLYRRGAVYWADLRDHGGGRRSTGCSDQAAAYAKLAQMIVHLERVAAGLEVARCDIRPSEAFRVWGESLVARGLDEAYRARAVACVQRHLGGLRRLTEYTPAKAERDLLRLRSQRSPKTCNNVASTLRAFFAFAIRYGWVSENPIRVEAFPNKAPKRRRALSMAELGKLLTCEKIPAERRRVYGILTYTGLRAGELSRLTWGNIDHAEQTIRVPASIAKSGRNESIILGGAAMRVLGSRPTSSLLLAKKVPSCRRFKCDLRLAGVCDDDSRGRTAVLHSLRHTYRSMLAAVGASDSVAKVLMRHSMGDITDRYLDENLLELREVVNRLPKVG
jgi:integrase